MATKATAAPAIKGTEGSPLDAMLTDATLGTVRRWLPGAAGAKLAIGLARHPGRVARRSARTWAELAKVSVGRSRVAPSAKDRRFQEPAWTDNPWLRRVCQTYLIGADAIDGLVDDADLDWSSERRMRFLTDNLVDALSPSNNPFLNPAALKAALDTGGGNFVKGARYLARDMGKKPRIPMMVDESAFEVGESLAVTPGSVVLRTPLFELIQYEPRAERVRATPLVLVPPMINKFYIADLAPGRSMLEHFLESGQAAFAMSWRNPDERHSDWGLDDYVTAVLDALEAVERITGSERTHLLGLCAGGIVSSVAVAHLAAIGQQERIAGLALGVTVLDQERAGTVGAIVDRPTAELAKRESRRRGYLDGRALAGVFAFLRPNDLVWNYWVNNYLLGKKPPAFDVLYWNADTTRMPAALHHDFLEMTIDNSLVQPGALHVLGTPIDLGKVDVDLYALAGIADHITPWENCYRSAHLFGSAPRFALSTSGHIAALVNPPGNPKASFRINEALPTDPQAWLRDAETKPGSWWVDYTAWLAERSGPEQDPPERLGAEGFEPLGPAPGTYVFDRY
jgi:polyhydroxyalkanoate synthase subunit PhaC